MSTLITTIASLSNVRVCLYVRVCVFVYVDLSFPALIYFDLPMCACVYARADVCALVYRVSALVYVCAGVYFPPFKLIDACSTDSRYIFPMFI